MTNLTPTERRPLAETSWHLSPQNFLSIILPKDGYICVTSFIDGIWKNHFFDTADEALEVAFEIDRLGGDAYHGCFTYKTKENRTANNTAYARAFWLDLDVGDDKEFASQGEASVESARGDWCKLWWHLFLVICDGDHQALVYLLNWRRPRRNKPARLSGAS